MKRILLVNPPETEQLGFSNPPLGLLYVAGTLVRNGFDVRVVDGCLDGKAAVVRSLREFGPDLVGVTCLTPGRKKALEMARLAKEIVPAASVVLGGAHATIMYRQILENYPFVDYVVLGEGESTCLELARGDDPAAIAGLARRDPTGAVNRPSRREYADDLDSIPMPAWHLVDLNRYPPWNTDFVLEVNGINLEREPRISVAFSRGCKGHCSFCSTWWIWRGWRRRSPENMADELELLNRTFGIRHICFADDAMTIDREATIRLCDEIVERRLHLAFHITTRTDCVDAAMLAKLKQAGCYSVAYGIETASQALLKRMNKGNEVESARRAIRMTKAAGLSVTTLLIVGNVGETDKTIEETIRFLDETRPDVVGCTGSLWILPGTKLYQDCRRAGFIDDAFWLSDEPFKVYTMEHDVAKLRKYARRIFWKNIDLRRILVRKLRKVTMRFSAPSAAVRPS